MASRKYDTFTPIVTYVDNDQLVGLQNSTDTNSIGTLSALATYMQGKLNFSQTYQNIYDSGAPRQTQLNGTNNPVNYLNDAGNNVLSITGGGTKSSLPIYKVEGSTSIDANILGSVNTNNAVPDPAAAITITAQLNDGFLIGSSFEMLRENTGTFTLTCSPGVTLNGVDGASIALPLLFSRLKITKIGSNAIAAVEYSGGAIAATPPLQDVYAAGRAVTYVAGEPIEITLPNHATNRFVTTNSLDGVNGQFLYSDRWLGKNNLSQDILYGLDSLVYRTNLTAPFDVNSSSRIFSVAVNSLLVDYLRLDGGTRTAYIDSDFVNITGVPTLHKNSGIGEFKFLTNYNGSIGDTSLLLSSQKKTSTGGTKISDALRIMVTDNVSATYSESFTMQAFTQNVAQDIFNYSFFETTLQPILRLRGNALGVEPRFIFDNPNNSVDEANLVRFFCECKASTGESKDFSSSRTSVVNEFNATFSTDTSLVDWYNGTQRTFLESNGILQQVKMFGNFINYQNHATYGTAIKLEDMLIAQGVILSSQQASTITKTALITTQIAGEAIPVANIVTTSTTADFRLVNHPIAGHNKAIGVCTSAAAGAETNAEYAYIGDITVRLEDNVGCTSGDILIPSTNAPGRAAVNNSPGAASQGFAVCWESVAGDVAGALVVARMSFSSAN